MKEYYLKKADENLPKLNKVEIAPCVDATVLNSGDTLIIDLGNHYVGYLTFKLWFVDLYIDAPVRMAVRFCETARELEEEIINVDFPGEYRMPRRYAARYVKFKIIHTPKQLSLSNFVFEAETSADVTALLPFDPKDDELAAIDKVATNTLKNCMQRVFEDGPKRDRRLWIGDLRLEALANYYTFNNFALVRRCLYLFAAADRNERGFMPGFIYENPIFVSGSWFLADYSLMYVCTLCDYFRHTGDTQTFRELYPIAKSIMDSAERTKDADGLVTVPEGDIFIDWCEGLKKNTSLMGIYLYTLDLWYGVLKELHYPEADEYAERLARGKEASLLNLYDAEKGAFINAKDEFQYSVHSTAWMILGGVITGEAARSAIIAVLNSEASVKPFTPYMHHYVTEALIKAGLTDEAEKYLRKIWGGMLKSGADTFAEVYVPGDPDFSPYGDRKVNSMCHAWSCTPTYFIRKYELGV